MSESEWLAVAARVQSEAGDGVGGQRAFAADVSELKSDDAPIGEEQEAPVVSVCRKAAEIGRASCRERVCQYV